MPRPFGVWAPATTLNEYKARVPGPGAFYFRIFMQIKKHEYYYHPDAMAWFKDPQTYKDAVDTLRRMKVSDKFFGEGYKLPHHALLKLAGIFVFGVSCAGLVTNYYYTRYIPANNPTWRKVVNKEWAEAINNSPWDHMSHVYQYTDISAANLGNVQVRGKRHFIIPA